MRSRVRVQPDISYVTLQKSIGLAHEDETFFVLG